MSEHRKSDDVEMLIAEFVASGARELHVRSDDFELYLSNDSDSPGIDGGRPSVPVEIGAGSPRRVDSVRPAPTKPEPVGTAAVAGVDLADLPDMEPVRKRLLEKARGLFQGIGLGSTWQLHLPKRSNDFDFRRIFDVNLIVYYNAKFDLALRTTVLALPPRPGEMALLSGQDT
jgi:hypothetical protein